MSGKFFGPLKWYTYRNFLVTGGVVAKNNSFQKKIFGNGVRFAPPKNEGLATPLSLICRVLRNNSNPTMRTGLDFKFAQFDQIRGEAED
jgi:hypothetical protein